MLAARLHQRETGLVLMTNLTKSIVEQRRGREDSNCTRQHCPYADADHQSSITSAIAVEKIIGGKRDRLRHLLIRNYEPPKTPLYTAAASQMPLMDLFGLDMPAQRRAALSL